MATALRKAQEPPSAGRAPDEPDRRDVPEPDVMIDPLHPMHQRLLARFSAPVATGRALTSPPPMALAFYAGIAAWGVVWLAFESVGAWP